MDGTLLPFFQFRYFIVTWVNVVVRADIFILLGPRIHCIDRFDGTLKWIFLGFLLLLSIFFLADAIIDQSELIINRHLVQLRDVLELRRVYLRYIIIRLDFLRSIFEPASEYIRSRLEGVAVLTLFEHFVDDDSIGELL